MPRVVHCKHEVHDVYIGRPGPWGNPFAIGKDGTRSEVIRKFETFFHQSQDKRAVWMREHIFTLRGKTLGCWCAPQACHGDVLLNAANGNKLPGD